MENYHEWTACQMYGHRYYLSEDESKMICQDCGDSYEAEVDEDA